MRLIDSRLAPLEQRLERLLDVQVSQAEAARQLGVTRATIINYEKAGMLQRVSPVGQPRYRLEDVLTIHERS